ncbi:MAG: oligosaccharide flippase family protein [Candidatus Omnitrophica bacterium]|nr:oligosaccharide flippase family protein [Candidatus Omnitrophota bacterium]
MFEEMKRFGRNSFVYACGNVLNRGAAFILLPLYTHVMNPADFGILSLFYLVSTIAHTLLSMGLAHATLRFYFEYTEEKMRRTVVSTALFATMLIGVGGTALAVPFIGLIASALFQDEAYAPLFYILFGTLVLELVIEVSKALIRAQERPMVYVLSSVFKLLAQVGFNVYTVVILKKGIQGILLGNLASVFLLACLLIPFTLKYSGFRFNLSILKSFLRYSFPMIPATVIDIVIRSLDRILLLKFSTLAVIGLYSLGGRFSLLLTELFYQPFTIAFGPHRFSIMKQENAREIYARFLTYFVTSASFLWLGVSVFAKEAVQLIASDEYLEAYRVVPLVVSTVILMGCSYIFQTGILLTKKTKYVFYVTACCAVFKVILLFSLVPRFNMYGAAIATPVGSLLGAALTCYFSQKEYPVSFEWARVFKGFGAALALFLVSTQIRTEALLAGLALKGALVLTYPFILGMAGFFRKGELVVLNHLIRYRAFKPGLVSQ